MSFCICIRDSTVKTDFYSHHAQFETTFLPIHLPILHAHSTPWLSKQPFSYHNVIILILLLSELLEHYFCYQKVTCTLSGFYFTVIRAVVYVEQLLFIVSVKQHFSCKFKIRLNQQLKIGFLRTVIFIQWHLLAWLD